MSQALHGGAFFDAIGVDLRHLERVSEVVSADVLDAWFDPSPCVIATLREHLPFLLRTSPPNHAGGFVAEIPAGQRFHTRACCYARLIPLFSGSIGESFSPPRCVVREVNGQGASRKPSLTRSGHIDPQRPGGLLLLSRFSTRRRHSDS